VSDFIRGLGGPAAAALAQQIGRLNLLNDAVPHLPFPHSSQIDGELRELRCHYGRDLFRVLYCRSDRLIVLLHAISKRSRTVPKADIRLALERFDDFRTRMNAVPRTPPRAAGHDVP
jgi:phage-related protein